MYCIFVQINGLWILLTTAVIFLSLPKYYQELFYIHFWTHVIMSNLVGLCVSVYFFCVGGEEKYARCVTKDQVQGGHLIKPIALAEPVSELTRFFNGKC